MRLVQGVRLPGEQLTCSLDAFEGYQSWMAGDDVEEEVGGRGSASLALAADYIAHVLLTLLSRAVKLVSGELPRGLAPRANERLPLLRRAFRWS